MEGNVGAPSSNITVRRVRPGDERLLREVRLRALRTDPGAYGATFGETAARGDEFWCGWAAGHAAGDDACTLLAFIGEQPVGLVRVERQPDRPAVFSIYSMWVAPEARRRGLGLRLLADAERWIAGSGGSEAELQVVDRAAPARALYGRAGYWFDGRREPSVHTGSVERGMRKRLRGGDPPHRPPARYMVIERFTLGAAPIYERLAARGRLLPPGLVFVESWVDERLDRCFQLMETDDPSLFDRWIAEWRDLAEFEVVPVIGSAEAKGRTLGW